MNILYYIVWTLFGVNIIWWKISVSWVVSDSSSDNTNYVECLLLILWCVAIIDICNTKVWTLCSVNVEKWEQYVVKMPSNVNITAVWMHKHYERVNALRSVNVRGSVNILCNEEHDVWVFDEMYMALKKWCDVDITRRVSNMLCALWHEHHVVWLHCVV